MMLRFREHSCAVVCGGVTMSSWENMMEALERFVEFRESRKFQR